MPNLIDLQERTEYEIEHTVVLSPESWVLFLAAFQFFDSLLNWSGAEDELTASEIDEIEALVAEAYAQLTGG